MAEFKAPIRDMQFVLNEVWQAPELWASMENTQEVTPDLVNAILEEGARLCENELEPLNRNGDEEGCHWQDSVVTTPKGFKEAYRLYAENGWTGLGGSPEYGGQGMPKMLTVMFEEMLFSANTSFGLYTTLASGACMALDNHASDALKQRYLPKLYDGTWAGSMCLTEPHCGTDLGIIKTRAEPQDDGSYRLNGTKIFITGGEHDLTENIIHLVLAKLPDAPSGTKGISLFLVPKFMVNDDDSLGARNGVSCGSIEHKMGIKGSATCVMNFDDAVGYLVGEVNRGLQAMFTMMNYERLSVGIQGIGLGEASYQQALAYAKDRLQGRATDGPRQPEKSADPILVHPDVRRMLLTQKAYNEGARAFASYVGMQLDIAKNHSDAATRARADALVALLTPVAKAYFTDRGFDVCVLGQQVFGGHGYIREWGMEQYVRDARITQIYEGTNGIQALDLMGRKVVANGGEWLSIYVEEIEQYLNGLKQPELQPFKEALDSSLSLLRQATEQVVSASRTDLNEIGAAGCDYLNLFGLVSLGYVWTRMAEQAIGKDDTFYRAKLKTARFFIQKLLPETTAYFGKIKAGSAVLMEIDEDEF
ncbi:acyl-CoA dehydrogenase C-terminal domain-containing protein [Gynuella sunshinyii]|uniref:3-methylmercaptopropionyl-CoA dehydrogenase n=1 Tax=Gynuella sunshinyii YC6258 TaxID=1445510 RepID=A0A0C5V1T9_9GAMM|nr:acyl-CoA dehydrogenase C-terminal domain-containing protein [Gynuella sunshinyii]AJQ93520.1 acyl-CoA dehydrogenase [Gynuella sunshinyii YC6258]